MNNYKKPSNFVNCFTPNAFVGFCMAFVVAFVVVLRTTTKAYKSNKTTEPKGQLIKIVF